MGKNRTYDLVSRTDHVRAFLHAGTVFGYDPDIVIGKHDSRSFGASFPDPTGRAAVFVITFQIAKHTGFSLTGMLSGFEASDPSKPLNIRLSGLPIDDDIHLRLGCYRDRIVRFQSRAAQPLDFRSYVQLIAALSYGITP